MKANGKVLVVGPREVRSFLEAQFSRRFSAALFLAPEDIKLKVAEDSEAFYGSVNLSSFSYALLLPDSSKREFYFTLAKILSDKGVRVSVDPETLLYFWQEPVVFRKLSKAGVPVRKIYAISQDVAGEIIKEELKLPLIIAPPSGKVVYVTNEQTLKSVLSLFSPGRMIVAQKPIRAESTLVVFVSPTEVVAYERVGNGRKATVADDKAKEIVGKVREALKTDFCTVFLIKERKKYIVSSVRLLPPFKTFKEVTGKDIASIMANDIEEMLPSFSLAEAFERVLVDVGKGLSKFARWLRDEIGNFRANKKRI